MPREKILQDPWMSQDYLASESKRHLAHTPSAVLCRATAKHISILFLGYLGTRRHQEIVCHH